MDEKMGAEGQAKPESGVSRRRLLKMLAAAGLAVSVERLLPGGWLRPAASVSAGGFPGYPGACTAENFPLVIQRTRASLVNAFSGHYQLHFAYNEVGGYLDNEACIFATVLGGEEIYKGQTLLEANGYVLQEFNRSVPLPCLTPGSTEGRDTLPTVPIYDGNGTYFFYYVNGTSAQLPAGRDAADELTVEWYLLEPDDRMSNTVQTITTPLAVSLSDLDAGGEGDNLKTAAAAGVAAAALGAVTVKALSNRGQEDAPQES